MRLMLDCHHVSARSGDISVDASIARRLFFCLFVLPTPAVEKKRPRKSFEDVVMCVCVRVCYLAYHTAEEATTARGYGNGGAPRFHYRPEAACAGGRKPHSQKEFTLFYNIYICLDYWYSFEIEDFVETHILWTQSNSRLYGGEYREETKNYVNR